MAANQGTGEKSQSVDIVSNAASEASKPGADTESQYECPFCVMMRKGGCEDVFKAFMECGEKADKGDMEMADCLPQFEQLHLCMEKNKTVFDGLLQEMKEEEERSKAAAGEAAGGSSSTAEQHQPSSNSTAAAGVTTHQQEGSESAAAAAAAAAAKAQSSSLSSSIEQMPTSQPGDAAAAGGMAAVS